MTEVISIRWVPKDALDGMQMLDAMEELAYRRLIDLIYVTDDNLEDDDRKLAWATKTGKQWKKIKESLLQLGKIEISDSKIRNRKCSFTLSERKQYIEQKRNAGISSSEKRKSLKNNDTDSTGVSTSAPTDTPTERPTDTPTGSQPALSLKPLSKQTPPLPPKPPDGAGAGVLKNGSAGGASFDIVPRLSDDGLAAARRAAPDWDVYRLAVIYNAGIAAGKREPPAFPDKAFPEWCRRYVGGKPRPPDMPAALPGDRASRVAEALEKAARYEAAGDAGRAQLWRMGLTPEELATPPLNGAAHAAH